MKATAFLATICEFFVVLLLVIGPARTVLAQGEDPVVPTDEDPFGEATDDDPFGEGAATTPAEDGEKPDKAAADVKQPGDEKDQATEDDANAAEEKPAAPPPVDPRVMRVFLVNGNVLTGELVMKEFAVTTAFGQLRVPVLRISSLTPGLEKHENVHRRIEELIEQLGVDDYRLREEAQKELVRMGPSVRGILSPFRDGDNAERIRRVKAILAQLEEAAAEGGALEGATVEWIVSDKVVTDRFTIVGDVSPDTLALTSKYGELEIPMADVKMVRRLATMGRESVAKSLSITGEYLAQLKYKSSGLRVEKGDKVTVSATGRISRSGSSSYWSAPDGSSRFGSVSQNPPIAGGTLVARIGGGGKMIRIGSRHQFTATRSGLLQFAIAMRSDYVGRYQFPGQYTLKVRVVPPQ